MTIWNHKREPMPRVAVIGTGTMGTAMARRLLASGMEINVWSRHAASTMPLVELGATAYEKAADAVRDADVVITMLATAEATADVMFGEETLRAMPPKSVWAQMATIGVEATERLATETRTRRPDVDFVDAPVSGSRGPAERGPAPHPRVGSATGGAVARAGLLGVGKSHALAGSGGCRQRDEARAEHVVGLPDRRRGRGRRPGRASGCVHPRAVRRPA
jgi:3-hydroxyisobutyrate dehydrogenase-like beta-hydroxyacid dehydrogenase